MQREWIRKLAELPLEKFQAGDQHLPPQDLRRAAEIETLIMSLAEAIDEFNLYSAKQRLKMLRATEPGIHDGNLITLIGSMCQVSLVLKGSQLDLTLTTVAQYSPTRVALGSFQLRLDEFSQVCWVRKDELGLKFDREIIIRECVAALCLGPKTR